MSLNETNYKRNSRKALEGKISVKKLMSSLERSDSCPIESILDDGSDLDE